MIVTRTWRFDERGSLHLEERIEGHNQIQFESRLCLGDGHWDGIDWDTGAGTGGMRCRLDSGEGVIHMRLACFPGAALRLEPCDFLVEYGQAARGRVAVLTASARLPLSWSVAWEFGESV